MTGLMWCVSKPGVCRDTRPDSPPAGRNGTCFVTNMWLVEPHVCDKAKKSTMLPPAILPFTG
jgi:hypothetical protein